MSDFPAEVPFSNKTLRVQIFHFAGKGTCKIELQAETKKNFAVYQTDVHI